MRVLDGFNFGITLLDGSSPEKLGDDLRVTVECTVFTRWGPGFGKFEEVLAIVTPDGNEVPEKMISTFVKPEGYHFQQLRHQILLGVNVPGTYRFRLYLDGQVVAEHPFQVNIEINE